jgi:Flp pilus assembly protein TadG
VRGASSQVARGGAPSLSHNNHTSPPAVNRRTSHHLSRNLADERGVAMVEFALILPVLLGIVLGIIQFGTGFNYWNDLNQMAADGARFAAVNTNPVSGSNLTTYIVTQADASQLRNDPNTKACLMAFDGTSGASETLDQAKIGDAVKVSVSTPYTFITLGPLNIGSITLRGNATMRIERISQDAANPGIKNLGTPCSP